MDLEHRQLIYRPRRLRRNANIRGLMRETRVTLDDLIMPVFVTVGKNKKYEIPSMPGIYQWSLDKVGHHIADLMNAGITRVILFGIPAKKDATGSDSYSDTGIIQQTVKFLRANFPELYIITDVCLCEYTDHGHCGIIHDNDVHNDTTLGYLQQQVVSHARAGVDMVAPSGMMDGMVEAIRGALDENEFENLPILSYAVKYASSYYGPFREAAESAPQFGDRQTYQMDPANVREGLKEADLDSAEGADIIMVKPALAYLDVIARVKDMTNLPVACYNVSGEYSMIKAAADKGWIDGAKVMLETLTAMKRAGADIILTYFALEAAQYLK